jgi:hypothetical protein
MNADQVMKYAKAKWPNAMKSEIADTVAAGSDVLKAFDDAAETGIIKRQIKADAKAHAINCLRESDGWDVETLSHNIESNFPELTSDECDSIAEIVFSA